MDQFGVLVESIGFKSNGRSAPMADLKNKPKSKPNNNGFPPNLGYNSGHNSNFVDDLDGIFKSNNNTKPQNYGSNGVDDIFGGHQFYGSKSASTPSLYDGADDLFGKMPGLKTTGSGTFLEKSGSIDDIFGVFGGMGINSNGSVKLEDNVYESDDLIPGFGGTSPPSTNGEIKANVTREQRIKENDRSHRRLGKEDAMFETANDLDSFFGMGAQSTRQNTTIKDPVFDALFQNGEKSKVEPVSSRTSSSTNKAPSVTNSIDDFSLFFGSGEAALSSGDFQEIPGESAERRKARFKHHKNTQERMAKALDEMNQRDRQNLHEQEERHRIADALNDRIKRWSAGKEGNLRALLSSLQLILWPSAGWETASLTDLITSGSVKKVYFKATLCVHPDKVQQKGADVQQKYIAEKVFDLLKEAWNKFSSEEL